MWDNVNIIADYVGQCQLCINFRHKAFLGCHYPDPSMYPLSPKNTALHGF